MTTPRPGLPDAWGVSAEEWELTMPGDEQAGPDWVRVMRGASCDAPPERLWPWLCQLRRAPYSYDLLDNFGRRSPRTLDPGGTDLRVGQRMVAVFRLAAFEPGVSITLVARPGSVFGSLLIGYRIVPDGSGSRLLAVLRHPRHHGLQAALDRTLAWGDLLMMRKQLRTLTALASGRQ